MGARYVARAVALMPGDLDPRFKDMGDRTRIVLLTMAGTCLDYDGATAPAGYYFRGWHVLANALGFPNAHREGAGHTAVKRTIRDLRERGIIELIGPAEPNRPTARRVYLLTI